MFQVHCIECKTEYEDKEPDDYYCSVCLPKIKEIARKIDAKLKTRPRKEVVSNLVRYDSLPKIRGFVDAKHFL
ncbi:MAG: hypothetical protein UT82_C0028G0010 [Parcubacteria group bacterium GW2011_GWB1_40_14]|nr:MAG: hypothetical protein UT82_C0028G0010 [Parcubacteria group bacterium GW2011_GWB1_40_14]